MAQNDHGEIRVRQLTEREKVISALMFLLNEMSIDWYVRGACRTVGKWFQHQETCSAIEKELFTAACLGRLSSELFASLKNGQPGAADLTDLPPALEIYRERLGRVLRGVPDTIKDHACEHVGYHQLAAIRSRLPGFFDEANTYIADCLGMLLSYTLEETEVPPDRTLGQLQSTLEHRVFDCALATAVDWETVAATEADRLRDRMGNSTLYYISAAGIALWPRLWFRELYKFEPAELPQDVVRRILGLKDEQEQWRVERLEHAVSELSDILWAYADERPMVDWLDLAKARAKGVLESIERMGEEERR